MATLNGTSNVVNCTALSVRSSFPSYIQALRDATGNNFTLLSACKADICNALFGIGNSDISGMIIGYLLESFLAFSFGLALELIRSTSSRELNFWHRRLALRGCNIFFDCAIYFAASIQIACVVVLVRKDFGISADYLGSLTVEITWVVALLSLLPLLFPLIMLGFFVEGVPEREREEPETSIKRHRFRFYMFCLCWVLFLYTFISRMIGYFAPSQIGVGAAEGGGTIISTDEFETILVLCFTGVQYLSDTETRTVEAFGIIGSIVLSLFVLSRLLWLAVESRKPNVAQRIEEKSSKVLENTRMGSLLPRALLVVVPLLTIAQVWGVFRIRNVQQALANATGNVYQDNQWTFGQVVAVVIFTPVIIELGYTYHHHQYQ